MTGKTASRRVIIAGAGATGLQAARYLAAEGHEVALIESDGEKARHASERLDFLVLTGQAANPSLLREAGAAGAEAVVAVTGSDEANLIICGQAKALNSGVKTIARVQSESYAEGGLLGVDCLVHPDLAVSRFLLEAIEHGASGDMLTFAGVSYELGSVDIAAGSAFDGLAVKNYRALDVGDSLLTLVERDGETFLPSGAAVLHSGDRVYVLARESEIDKVFALSGRKERVLRKIGVVGASRTGCLVIEGLLHGENRDSGGKNGRKTLFSRLSRLIKTQKAAPGASVVIIERDYELCKELSGRFPEALVLNEDISDENFIAEERISTLDLIVTSTKNQELNMIASLYLKKRGVRRAAAVVSSAGYGVIARQLGIDVVAPEKQIVADAILSELSGSDVKRVQHLGAGDIALLEIDVNEDAPIAGKPIMAFAAAAASLVLLVRRGSTSFIPRGDYVFETGDRIIVVTKGAGESGLAEFFGP